MEWGAESNKREVHNGVEKKWDRNKWGKKVLEVFVMNQLHQGLHS